MLAVIAAILVWPLCAGRTLYWGDILLYFEPMQQFARQELRTGRLPLWNPYISCGQPFVGNPQMNVFYPATLLLLFSPVWLAISITAAAHLFLCGAFMYLFLRRWTVYTAPAIAGAIVYMGSALILGRLQFPPMVQTAAFFPLLFAVLDANIDRPGLRVRLTLSVVVAAALLAAHTQVAYLAFSSGAVYMLMRLWRRRPTNCKTVGGTARRAGRPVRAELLREIQGTLMRALPLAAAGAFGLLLVAIYFLPAVQLVHESSREKMTVSQANRFFADLPHLLAVLFPRFTGHPSTRDFWARGNAWEPAWFVGWTPLVLAGYATVRCRGENLVRFWIAFGLTGFWLAFGIAGGLYWLAFYIVPGLGSFHDPARFLLWTTVAVSALTAVGLDALCVRRVWRGPWPARLVLASIVAPLLWFAGDWLPTTEPKNLALHPAGLSRIRSAAVQDRVAVPANTLYWKRVVGDGYIDYGNSDTQGIQRTVNTLVSNLDMRNGLESASGYEPVPVGNYAAMDNLITLAQQRREPTTARLFALMDVRLLLEPRIGVIPTTGFRDAGAASNPGPALSGWRASSTIARTWLTRRITRTEGRIRVGALLTAPGFNPLGTTIVSAGTAEVGGALEALSRPSINTPGSAVAWNREGPGTLRLYPEAGATPAFVVYSGTAFPGWKATVDGVPKRLYCADGMLLGLPVPAGRHEIVLTYAPDMFRIGAYISLAALSALTGLFIRQLIRRRMLRAGSAGN